jgi:hypothetical protein
VLVDESRHNLAVGGERLNGCHLIFAHEAAVAFDIGTQDGHQLPFNLPHLVHSLPLLSLSRHLGLTL